MPASGFPAVFQHIEPWLAPALVPEACRPGIRSISARFPGHAWGALECRLAAGDAPVDFMLSLSPAAVEALSAASPAPPATPWLPARGLLERALPPQPPLRQLLDCCWLEYDLPPEALTEAPLLFTVFHPWPYDFQLLAGLLRAWLGGKASATAPVAHCVRRLPPGMNLYALGFLDSRSPHRIRLVVKAERPESAISYLQTIGWPGDVTTVKQMLSTFAGPVDRFLLHLDLDRGLLSSLGVELCVLQGDRPSKMKALLDGLVASGCCDEQKKEAVLAWEGRCCLPGGGIHGQNREWERYANYVKLNFRPDGDWLAKTYLFYRQTE